MKWCIDAAFAVHMGMRSQIGGFMAMGTGGAYVKSSKQKLNTKSSTEDKLVRVDDVLNQVIWTEYFRK